MLHDRTIVLFSTDGGPIRPKFFHGTTFLNPVHSLVVILISLCTDLERVKLINKTRHAYIPIWETCPHAGVP